METRSTRLFRQARCSLGRALLTSTARSASAISLSARARRSSGCSVDKPLATDCTSKSATRRRDMLCGYGKVLRTCWSVTWISTRVRKAPTFINRSSPEELALFMTRSTLAVGGSKRTRRDRPCDPNCLESNEAPAHLQAPSRQLMQTHAVHCRSSKRIPRMTSSMQSVRKT